MVTLALLLDYAGDVVTASHRVRSVGRPLTGPRVWLSEEDEPPRGYVYLVDATAGTSLDELRLCKKYDYIVYGSEDPALPNVSYAFVDSSRIGFMQLMGRIQGVFEYFYKEFYLKLVYAVAKNDGVEELLEISSPFFKNPMYVADSAFMLLARTRTIEVRNPTPQWTSIATREILDPDIANKLKVSDIKKLDRLRKATFIETIDARGVRNIVAHVEKQGSRIANLAVIECETPLQDYHLALADFLIDCIFLAIENQSGAQNTAGGLCERWISLLLQGEIVEESQIAPHLEKLQWSNGGCFQVAVIDFIGKPQTGTSSLNYYWGMISSMVLGQKCFIYEGAIVILFHYPQKHFAVSASNEPLLDFLDASKLRGAFSGLYDSVLETAAHYAQAKRIRRFATPKRPVVRHSEAMVDDVVSSTPFDEDWRANVCPEIAELARQDERNQTNLVETLYVYLLCDRSLKECSAKMRIHKNTLAYRIKKIQERYALDFSDTELRLALILSCRICLRHMGESEVLGKRR